MKKLVIVFMVCILCLISVSCNGSLKSPSQELKKTQIPSENREILDSSQKGNNVIPSKTTKSPSDPENVKAQYYDIETFVNSYSELLTDAVNHNDFGLIKNYLDENNPIYLSQKKYLENFPKGTTLNQIYLFVNETKQIETNLFKVIATEKIEIIKPDGSHEVNVFKKVFTVFDDGNSKKVRNIEM